MRLHGVSLRKFAIFIYELVVQMRLPEAPAPVASSDLDTHSAQRQDSGQSIDLQAECSKH